MTDPDALPESLADVAATGDRLAILEALRDTLARAIDAGPPARDLAALSRRLVQVVDALAGGTTFDDELNELLSTPTDTTTDHKEQR